MTQRIQIEHIVAATCSEFRVTRAQIHGRSRLMKIALPRQIAMVLSRELTGRSFPSIGKYFDRDHTTVLHARNSIRTKRAASDDLCLRMSLIKLRADAIASLPRPSWLVRDRDGNVLLESIADEKAQAA